MSMDVAQWHSLPQPHKYQTATILFCGSEIVEKSEYTGLSSSRESRGPAFFGWVASADTTLRCCCAFAALLPATVRERRIFGTEVQ
jgi:hypothetical protein